MIPMLINIGIITITPNAQHSFEPLNLWQFVDAFMRKTRQKYIAIVRTRENKTWYWCCSWFDIQELPDFLYQTDLVVTCRTHIVDVLFHWQHRINGNMPYTHCWHMNFLRDNKVIWIELNWIDVLFHWQHRINGNMPYTHCWRAVSLTAQDQW